MNITKINFVSFILKDSIKPIINIMNSINYQSKGVAIRPVVKQETTLFSVEKLLKDNHIHHVNKTK